MTRQERAPDRVADLIDPALRGLGVRGRVLEEQLRGLFAEIVGPALSPMCRAVQLERGVLLVATSNSALAHQLHIESQHVIGALNERLGTTAVRRLRFTAM